MRHHQPHGTGGNGILVKTKGGEKGNELLSSAAMPSFLGIGLSEMELADVSTSNCGSSRKSIFTSVDTTSWGEGGGDDVQFPSSPCYSTLTSQTSLIIPRARYSSQASPASSQVGVGFNVIHFVIALYFCFNITHIHVVRRVVPLLIIC